MGLKKAIQKKLQSEIEPIKKFIQGLKALWNKAIYLCFGWILKIAPKWLSSWYLKQTRLLRWLIPITLFLGIQSVNDAYEDNIFTCGRFLESLIMPIFFVVYIYAYMYWNRKYPKWFWPDFVRDDMASYYKDTWSLGWDAKISWENDEKTGKPIVWAPSSLALVRIWHSLVGGFFLTSIPLAIALGPFFSLLDKLFPGAECNFMAW